MKVSDYDFSFSRSLIADEPVEPRDHCKLLVLKSDDRIEERYFFNLPDYMEAGDLLLLNNTKVFPSRLTGQKKTGGKVEFLLVKRKGPREWEIMSRERISTKLSLPDGLFVNIINGNSAVFEYDGDIMEKLWEIGEMPLPPYIKRRPDERDKKWYQTVFAEKAGSIAAPTAGIHFTDELLSQIRAKGILVMFVTLHVGIGTFKTVRTERIEEHTMEPEYFELEDTVIKAIEKVKTAQRRVFAVGTTTTRAIEGFFSGVFCKEARNGTFKGITDIFIYPGYEFKVIDALITNFHLPRSTPLFLAAAFCGREKLLKAYRFAISKKYRFFSYGDAMLILR